MMIALFYLHQLIKLNIPGAFNDLYFILSERIPKTTIWRGTPYLNSTPAHHTHAPQRATPPRSQPRLLASQVPWVKNIYNLVLGSKSPRVLFRNLIFFTSFRSPWFVSYHQIFLKLGNVFGNKRQFTGLTLREISTKLIDLPKTA